MRIMIHSNAPWVPSGYGRQCALLMRVLRQLGHEVAVSAFYGLQGGPNEWEGHLVLPAGRIEYGLDVLLGHTEAWGADLVIALMDFWRLAPIAEQLRDINLAAWIPVDCQPLGMMDRETLRRSGARPIAMARFGERMLKDAGFETLYAPHMHDVDDEEFAQAEASRQHYREALGIADRYVIGLCAANNDQIRKGFPEQFEAFKRFHSEHPEALLRVHSIPRTERGLDLIRLAHEMGLTNDNVQFTDAYPQHSGAFGRELMNDWFSTLDLLTCCSYAEAFGVPMLEAQALGTPVVATMGSAMVELTASLGSYRVPGEPFWNHVHSAWWQRPRIDGIARAYTRAHRAAAPVHRERARQFAAPFHVDVAGPEHWKPILEELEQKPNE
jgi:glycosyltransferase involved in cell wall biosynthesis